jgi:hypothetical protein
MAAGSNPWIGITYIPDNPKMETPPAWFLQQLHDYDGDLVLFPSISKPFAYVVSRRRRFSRWSQAEKDVITNPDTQRCIHYGLIPVCLMFKHGPVWSADAILQKLKARDLWAHGGGEKVADMLEAQEAKEVADRSKAKREELYHLSGDAWRSFQARTGQRVVNPGPSPTGAATKSPSGSIPTGAGKILLA